MDVLPPGDPRVISTVEQIANRLTINGFVYRFDPRQTPGMNQPPTPRQVNTRRRTRS
jgi:GH15 family glucan-1,4-alpha-glucosidase